MYQKCFEEYFVSEAEIKEQIFNSLEFLVKNYPDEYSQNLLQIFSSNYPVEQILQILEDNFPSMTSFTDCLGFLQIEDCLIQAAIQLDIVIFSRSLKYTLPKITEMTFWKLFLGIEYIMAAEIIENRLNEEMQYNSDRIISKLMNPFDPDIKTSDKYLAPKYAREEIARVLVNEAEGENFRKIIDEFEKSIKAYIADNFQSLLLETLGRIAFEAVYNQYPLIEGSFEVKDPLTQDDRKNIVKILTQFIKTGTSKRLGIKRGGNRKKSNSAEFSWTDENKIEFYKTVKNLPRDKEKTFWDYAVKMLIVEADFSSDTVKFIKSRPIYKNVPPKLFDEARSVWRGFHNVASLKELPPETKPQAFEYRHALHNMNFPDEYSYSTLRTYYYDGQKLMKIIVENQN